MTSCDKAPKGWKCTRDAGHAGPCAAVKVPWYVRVLDALGNGLGEAKFGD
jgi:hypothetical protein